MKREIEFRGQRADNKEWVYGYYVHNTYAVGFAKEPTLYENHYIYSKNFISESWFNTAKVEVNPETVGQYTGITDKNGKKVYLGDKVKFFGMVGEVCFEQGCFGIGTQETIDWKKIKKQILPLTGCDNKPYFCENDNFVSFWELIWNFNGEDEQCDVCEVIGNIFDKESDNGD